MAIGVDRILDSEQLIGARLSHRILLSERVRNSQIPLTCADASHSDRHLWIIALCLFLILVALCDFMIFVVQEAWLWILLASLLL